ncbi:FecR domain-containing protein [Prevotella sp. A2931]|uniref:FecR domain-containing protein n=1 Tax=Prevotella illustrans TaxID=2800387 RepID=A0ABS3M5K2_9BACT|nr:MULTISPECIES: FecR domain-containing protein [Prevotella]MBO1363454.1 FecR domain-containing protein [Prevotella illustrans]PTL26334.1 hypothetical protein C3V39_04280 [Prevotella sp. oral taxon 820]
MKESNPDIDLLIGSFIDGTISREDFLTLKAWTWESDDHAAYVRRCLQTLVAARTASGESSFDTEAAIARFHARVGRERTGSGIKRVWLRRVAAAAVVLLVVLPWIGYRLGTNAVKSDFSSVVTEVPEGSQLNLKLPDGTTVKLNSGSTLTYSQGFGITDREVIIDGEGYFTVKHDDRLPFKVSTRELVLHDLGTEFSFRSYRQDDYARVNLFEGKVSLDNEVAHTAGHEMLPGERVVMNKRTGRIVKTSLEKDARTAREMTELTFDNATVAEIARELSRSYGARVEVAAGVAGRRFYGSFNRKENTLEQVLAVMSDTWQIRYKREKEKYILY